jgi:transcriptional regulator with XRE-family HTH domain
MADLGLTPRMLIQITGRSKATVYRWLNGKNTPKYVDIELLSEKFKISPSFFLGENKSLKNESGIKCPKLNPDLKNLSFGDLQAYFQENVSSHIEEYLLNTGLKQLDLAQAIGVPENNITYWKRKGGSLPETPKMYKLAEVIGCSIDQLLGGTPINPINMTPPWLLPLLPGLRKLSKKDKTLATDFLKRLIKDK